MLQKVKRLGDLAFTAKWVPSPHASKIKQAAGGSWPFQSDVKPGLLLLLVLRKPHPSGWIPINWTDVYALIFHNEVSNLSRPLILFINENASGSGGCKMPCGSMIYWFPYLHSSFLFCSPFLVAKQFFYSSSLTSLTRKSPAERTTGIQPPLKGQVTTWKEKDVPTGC